MSDRNGTTVSVREKLREARAARRLAEERRDLARLRHEERLLTEGYYGYTGGAWGDPVDPNDSMRDPDLQLVSGGNLLPGRRDMFAASQPGILWPLIKNERDLDEMRGSVRVLVDINDLAQGVVRRLRNFTVRNGYKWQAQAKAKLQDDVSAVAEQLAWQVQQADDEFVKLNRWAARERETMVRLCRDGENFFRIFRTDYRLGTSEIRVPEPEQFRRPLGSPPEWSWGILTERHDIEKRLAYWLEFDANTADGEEVAASEIFHLTANVDCTIKRGLSDFFCTHRGFDGINRLREALTICARIRGGIPWIEQFDALRGGPAGVGVAGNADAKQPPTDPVTGKAANRTKYTPGGKLVVGKGRTYLPPPSDAGAGNVQVAVGEFDIRCVGARWDMPEFMISGRGDNSAELSVLAHGSPFVTGIEVQQGILLDYFQEIHWAAIANYARAGRFEVNGHVFSLREIRQLVDIHGTPPQVAIANKAEEAEVDHKDIDAGVLSIRTRREKLGLDNDKERRNIAEEPATKPTPPSPFGGQQDPRQPPPPTAKPPGGSGGRPRFFPPASSAKA